MDLIPKDDIAIQEVRERLLKEYGFKECPLIDALAHNLVMREITAEEAALCNTIAGATDPATGA